MKHSNMLLHSKISPDMIENDIMACWNLQHEASARGSTLNAMPHAVADNASDYSKHCNAAKSPHRHRDCTTLELESPGKEQIPRQDGTP